MEGICSVRLNLALSDEQFIGAANPIFIILSDAFVGDYLLRGSAAIKHRLESESSSILIL